LTRKHLLDVNVLIALTEPGHEHYQKTQQWFDSSSNSFWGACPFTETGFLRITTNPAFRPGPRTLGQAITVLQMLKGYPRYCFWQVDRSWVDLTAKFVHRLFGHQQITDACLLGLAIKEDGVLVTFDRGLKYMAGAEFARNLLVIE